LNGILLMYFWDSEAIMVGPDLPAQLPIIMCRPEKGQQPESHGPYYQAYWGQSADRIVENSE
jgi:hypothetical protein